MAHFWVLSSMCAFWPVEGAEVLVVPSAGVRHDLFFFCPSQFPKFVQANFCPSRWGLAEVICKTQKGSWPFPQNLYQANFHHVGLRSAPRQECCPSQWNQLVVPWWLVTCPVGQTLGFSFTVPVSLQSGGLLESYASLGHNQIQSLYPQCKIGVDWYWGQN